MSHDVTSHWLFRINSISHATTWVSHDLVSHEYSNVKLLTNLLNPWKHSTQNLLPFSQLTSSRVVNSIWSHDRINDHQSKLIFNHGSCSLHYQIIDCINSKCPAYHDIVEHLFWVKTKFICNLFNPFWPKSVLSVNVQNFAFSSSTWTRKLGRHT